MNPEAPKPGVFLLPFEAIDPADARFFERELQGELRDESPLKGVPCRALAKRVDRDDTLFETALPRAAYVLVHLTWGPHPDPMPGIPHVELFADWDDFRRRRMIPEHDDWLFWEERA